MAKKKRKPSRGKASSGKKARVPKFEQTFLLMEYYQRPFALFHQALEECGYNVRSPHPVRNRFWQFVPQGEYGLLEGRAYLLQYLKTLEHHLRCGIEKCSLAYLLHLYRRLSPGPIGADVQPPTVAMTRAVFEAAIQKYGRFSLCDRIVNSKEVGSGKILGGLLLSEEFEIERQALVTSPGQIVLSNFDHTNLAEFYDLEKLAYEVWRTGATLRSLAKGAPLLVNEGPECFMDGRSEELNRLLQNYDERHREIHVAATGAIFDDYVADKGWVFLPTYNVGAITSDDFQLLFERCFKVKLVQRTIFNFIWVPFNLRGYRTLHLPLAEAFRQYHGVSLDAVLFVIAALLCSVLAAWMRGHPDVFFRLWQRAYEGCFTIAQIKQAIRRFLPAASFTLGLDREFNINEDEMNAAIDFWSLTDDKRKSIDLPYSGPHYLFLPAFADKWFIDYAWIFRRLYDLFFGISIADQNFKGEALEKSVRITGSILPSSECVALDNTRKQIDNAFGVGKHLVLVECKAVAWSIAYDRGDPTAIRYRRENVVERSLCEADAKASWLAEHPIGKNYDVSVFADIVPIGISPFIEFIPSMASRFWITENKPRVLTPEELREVLCKPDLLDRSYNRIQIRH